MIPRLLLAVSVAILAVSGAAAQPISGYGLGQQQQLPSMQELMQQQDVGFGSQYGGAGIGLGTQMPLGLAQQPWMMQSRENVNLMLSQQQAPWQQQQQQPIMQQQAPWMQQQGGLDEMELGVGGGEQEQLGLGIGQQEQLQQQQPVFGARSSRVMPAYGADLGVPSLGAAGLGLNLGLGQQQFGGVGSFGAAPGLGASKKTTTAAPIYAQSMIVPKIITQPILRPHSVTQPIVQQQLIQQPIVETRQVIQPVIRRIITQPIIRPEIYESTTIQPTLKTETTVQPHIVQQTVVSPTLQNQYEENAAITEKPRMQVQAPVVQPTISAKKSGGGLSMAGF